MRLNWKTFITKALCVAEWHVWRGKWYFLKGHPASRFLMHMNKKPCNYQALLEAYDCIFLLLWSNVRNTSRSVTWGSETHISTQCASNVVIWFTLYWRWRMFSSAKLCVEQPFRNEGASVNVFALMSCFNSVSLFVLLWFSWLVCWVFWGGTSVSWSFWKLSSRDSFLRLIVQCRWTRTDMSRCLYVLFVRFSRHIFFFQWHF